MSGQLIGLLVVLAAIAANTLGIIVAASRREGVSIRSRKFWL